MIIRNDNDLIGDFLGTVPAMQEKARVCHSFGLPCSFIVKDGVSPLLTMAGLERAKNGYFDLSFDLHAAFALAAKNDLHMTQANFKWLGLPVPTKAIRPVLQFEQFGVQSFDYILAPFSRSLPDAQLWPRQRWQALVDSMPDKQFCLFGAGNDDIDFIDAKNCTHVFDCSWDIVCNIMRCVKGGVISIVTGISHLAFALGVKNYLLVNQGAWGKNPDAVCIEKNIHDVFVDELKNIICQQTV